MDKEQLKHRILARTKKTSSCWFYIGTKASGYGTIVIDGKREVVHRLMYEIERGAIPEGSELDHLCGIKHCLNPDHLEPVSHLENTRRGPQYKGDEAKYKSNPKAPSRKKTHLLYIQEERFRSEPKKSALVNKLLTDYYDNHNFKSVLEKTNKYLNSARVPEEGRYVATPEGIYGPTKLEVKTKLCKNGHAIPEGRDRCMGKGCKYS